MPNYNEETGSKQNSFWFLRRCYWSRICAANFSGVLLLFWIHSKSIFLFLPRCGLEPDIFLKGALYAYCMHCPKNTRNAHFFKKASGGGRISFKQMRRFQFYDFCNLQMCCKPNIKLMSSPFYFVTTELPFTFGIRTYPQKPNIFDPEPKNKMTSSQPFSGESPPEWESFSYFALWGLFICIY